MSHNDSSATLRVTTPNELGDLSASDSLRGDRWAFTHNILVRYIPSCNNIAHMKLVYFNPINRGRWVRREQNRIILIMAKKDGERDLTAHITSMEQFRLIVYMHTIMFFNIVGRPDIILHWESAFIGRCYSSHSYRTRHSSRWRLHGEDEGSEMKCCL
jgi:hypothetical protein